MSSGIDDALNFGVPVLLLIIAAGFIYIKFIGPWVIPMFSRFWEWAKGKSEGGSADNVKKEISFE